MFWKIGLVKVNRNILTFVVNAIEVQPIATVRSVQRSVQLRQVLRKQNEKSSVRREFFTVERRSKSERAVRRKWLRASRYPVYYNT